MSGKDTDWEASWEELGLELDLRGLGGQRVALGQQGDSCKYAWRA